MDRNGIALNTLMFIRMSSNIFYPFSTIYPGSGYNQAVNLAIDGLIFYVAAEKPG